MLLLILIGCSENDRPSGETARVATAGSSATGTTLSSTTSAGAKAPCPATGQWSACAIVERLDRAGLAPRVDSTPASEPPLAPRGRLVRIGRAELELYLYGDAASRERDQAKLDRRKYLAAEAPIGMESQPTLVYSANLIAILHSRNDHQRERVSDAIAAGPPQPPTPRP